MATSSKRPCSRRARLGSSAPAVRIAASNCFAEAFVVVPNLVDRRPILGLIRWQASLYRVDAEGEELVKVRVEGRKAQGFPEKIPIKGFQVAQIKNNPVAFRDGAVVQCCGADNLEEFFAPGARRLEARTELVDPGRWRHCCRIHEGLLSNEFALQRPGQTG